MSVEVHTNMTCDAGSAADIQQVYGIERPYLRHQILSLGSAWASRRTSRSCSVSGATADCGGSQPLRPAQIHHVTVKFPP